MQPIALQKTLKKAVSCTGVGVHSGLSAELTIKPAAQNTGFIFIRTDITDKNNVIAGLWDRVTETRLCTVLSNKDGVSISTVEHVLSALAACGIDNAILEINSPEMPIMDGSAKAFVEMIDKAGKQTLSASKRYLRVKKPVIVEEDGKTVTLSPSRAPIWHMDIDFPNTLIGRQSHCFSGDEAAYRADIADCRTFGFLHEVEMLRKMGLARGGSLDNAVVVDGDTVLNPEGLRFKDEFVRHKILDAIGDLILAGAPMLADYHGDKAGHALNNKILHALFADKDAYEFISAERLHALPATHPRRITAPQPAAETAYL